MSCKPCEEKKAARLAMEERTMSKKTSGPDLFRTLHFVERTGKGNVRDSETQQNFPATFKGNVRGEIIARHRDAFKFKHDADAKQFDAFLRRAVPADLDSLTVPQLHEKAHYLGVDVPKDARKADLIAALKDR